MLEEIKNLRTDCRHCENVLARSLRALISPELAYLSGKFNESWKFVAENGLFVLYGALLPVSTATKSRILKNAVFLLGNLNRNVSTLRAIIRDCYGDASLVEMFLLILPFSCFSFKNKIAQLRFK